MTPETITPELLKSSVNVLFAQLMLCTAILLIYLADDDNRAAVWVGFLLIVLSIVRLITA